LHSPDSSLTGGVWLQIALDGRCQAYTVSSRESAIETVTLLSRSNDQALGSVFV